MSIHVTTTNVTRTFKSETQAVIYCAGLDASGTIYSLKGGSLRFRAIFFRHYMADTKKAIKQSAKATQDAASWIARIRVVLK